MTLISDTAASPPGRRVVVVGAGPTGLATAIELGSRGIECLVLEREEKRGSAPRAKTTHVRTREFLRRWGIADELAKMAPFGIDYPSDIHFVTRLSGYGLAHFANALNCSPARDERYSEHAQWTPQYKVEAVLKAKAEALPSISFQYGAEFTGLEQDGRSVRVHIRSIATGEEQVVDAAYLVGADGARSNVRDAIGARMTGTYGLSRNYNIIFEAPGLAKAHSHGPGIMFWQVNPDAPGTIGPMDEGDLWYFVPTHLPPDVTLTDDEAIALIKRSTGIDLPYRIISSDIWIASQLLADHHRQGRVFLVGDACHLHPPYGGYGMNMGVADGVDIGWKLAAVLQGWGGPALLDSYEAERRPVHALVLDEAMGNHAILANQLMREGIEDPTPEGEAVRAEVGALIREAKTREFYALGIVLGLRYCNSPVIARDGTEESWTRSRDYRPDAAPGCLAPHAWLDDDRSLYDLFGAGFTLLVLDDHDGPDIESAMIEADRTGTPLQITRLADTRILSLYGASRALIRPDQIVAWRGNVWPDDGLLNFAAGQDDLENPALRGKMVENRGRP